MNEELNHYIDFLLDYTQRINVISRAVSRTQVELLVDESLQAANLVTRKVIIDAGSGNGLLGIPLALHFKERRIVLVESALKKATFLRAAIDRLKLANVDLFQGPIQEFMHTFDKKSSTLVARGFPDNDVLAKYVSRGRIAELVMITSPEKVKKMAEVMVNVTQNHYNVPLRDKLIILKLENVSRGT
jgi:16S rRNA G527 N7-methylase RsmG